MYKYVLYSFCRRPRKTKARSFGPDGRLKNKFRPERFFIKRSIIVLHIPKGETDYNIEGIADSAMSLQKILPPVFGRRLP